MAKIAVLGAGAWGTALAMNISQRHNVSLWARNAGHVSGMRKARANPLYLGDFKSVSYTHLTLPTKRIV